MTTTVSSTSAAGPMILRHVREPLVLGILMAGLGTSPGLALPLDVFSFGPRPLQQTSAGVSVAPVMRPGADIAELRRLSGFTWDQLARLFGVSRRSLHFWASGKVMTPANEEHLARLLGAIRKIDRGSASANRAELLAPGDAGEIPFDLLATGRYDQVVALIGVSTSKPRVAAPKLSEAAMVARAPRRPEELVGALQDRVHRVTGKVRAARSARVRSGS